MSTEVKQEGDFKIKTKPGRPKKLTKTSEENTTKVDFKKQEEEAIQQKEKEIENAIQESSTEKVDVRELPKDGEQVGETHVESETAKESKEEVVIEEIEKTEKPSTSAPIEATTKPPVETVAQTTKITMPENVEKLIDFMEDTGGTLEDYVNLNKDYSDLNNQQLLREFYNNTKPHLNQEEITFLMEDTFAWDEDEENERAIRKKKLALKEEVAKARNFLESSKSKYYDEIKLRPSITNEQKKASEFFNRYNSEQEAQKMRHDRFTTNTKDFFNNDFKGFEYNIGDKNFRYKVNNTDQVADQQSDITNFVKKFLNEKGEIEDYQGYHKALYAARNADTLASHFYEQGKSDAVKNITAKSKNVSLESRPTPSGDIFINGLKVKAISGTDSSRLKIKKIKK